MPTIALENGLGPAVKLFAFSLGCKAMARKWAEGFSWSFGQEAVDKKQIGTNYENLAKDLWEKAVFMRDDYYKHWGKRNLPVANVKRIPQRPYDVRR